MFCRSAFGVFWLPLFCLATWGCSPAELGIEDLKEGEGPTAKQGDLVDVHYTGKLANGKTFDSSTGKKPFRFRIGVGEVIQGWDDGLPGMKVGGKRKLTVPSRLAYGEKGTSSGAVPPNATLFFEIELVKIITDPSEGKDGKVELPAGLKIEDIKEGTGAVAKEGDTVDVHYTGWLPNGKKFDSSHDRRMPFSFQIGYSSVIKGWHLGVVGMKVGGQRTLIIPPELAYGDESNGDIPANATLKFDIELLRILK